MFHAHFIPFLFATASPFPIAHDLCATPTMLAGGGPFVFATATATTGVEGQAEARCDQWGATAIDHDFWYCWTAPTTGPFEVISAGTTLTDTKIAVYDGCGCPLNPAIGCNDDGCGFSGSITRFDAVQGHAYTIQLGSGPGSPGGSGSFRITASTLPADGGHNDDGVSEDVWGAGSLHFVWMQSLGTVGVPNLVTSVSAVYGSPAVPGFGPTIGQAVDVLVWEDPDDNGNPVDAILVYQGTGVVGNVDNDVYDVHPTTPLVLDGKFLVGIGMQTPPNSAPAALDDDTFCQGGLENWYIANSPGSVDYTNLLDPTYTFPLTELSLFYFGHFMLRANCTTRASRNLCGNGDPLRLACPCGNNGANPLGGCANSIIGSTGATLRTSGFPATDDVVLSAQGMSGSSCIFLASTGTAVASGTPFGDGITCTGAALTRLRTVNFVGGLTGIAEFPGPADTITLSARSGTFPGSGAVIQYSTYYRNAAAFFCTPATFNVTDTDEIVW